MSLVFIVVLCWRCILRAGRSCGSRRKTWVVEDPLGSRDAIIVLSDDNFYADRAAHAADLYRHGWAPLVVASGRKLRPYAGVAELMQHDLIERGVPKDKISPSRIKRKTPGKRRKCCSSRSSSANGIASSS